MLTHLNAHTLNIYRWFYKYLFLFLIADQILYVAGKINLSDLKTVVIKD